MSTAVNLQAVEGVISKDRLGRYQRTAGIRDLEHAIELYRWNAEISCAFMLPQHIVEVAIRNAVSEAISQVYGAAWPWSAGFVQSLPGKNPSFDPRGDLVYARNKFPGQKTAGKVIPEMKFVFWQKMFTKRHDDRLWNQHLIKLFPGMPAGTSVSDGRLQIADDLDKIRKLRNRIAHHEPIYHRNLVDDINRLKRLLSWRCADTGAWLDGIEQVTALLQRKP